jgi:hypothetical protein
MNSELCELTGLGGEYFAVEVVASLSGGSAAWVPSQIALDTITVQPILRGPSSTVYPVLLNDNPAAGAQISGPGYVGWFDFPGQNLEGQYSSVTWNMYSALTDAADPSISCSTRWTVNVTFKNGTWSASFNGQPVQLSHGMGWGRTMGDHAC